MLSEDSTDSLACCKSLVVLDMLMQPCHGWRQELEFRFKLLRRLCVVPLIKQSIDRSDEILGEYPPFWRLDGPLGPAILMALDKWVEILTRRAGKEGRGSTMLNRSLTLISGVSSTCLIHSANRNTLKGSANPIQPDPIVSCRRKRGRIVESFLVTISILAAPQ
jgi:hypothetical protein